MVQQSPFANSPGSCTDSSVEPSALYWMLHSEMPLWGLQYSPLLTCGLSENQGKLLCPFLWPRGMKKGSALLSTTWARGLVTFSSAPFCTTDIISHLQECRQEVEYIFPYLHLYPHSLSFMFPLPPGTAKEGRGQGKPHLHALILPPLTSSTVLCSSSTWSPCWYVVSRDEKPVLLALPSNLSLFHSTAVSQEFGFVLWVFWE
jgi:hypothetical protein